MINPENDRNLHKLILSLNHKLSPSVYFISCNTEKLRRQLYESITLGSPRFRHLLIDLTPHSVYSLRDAINQFVPDEVLKSAALTYVIHFTGISSSLFTSKGGEFKKSMLLEELNFEREVLFQDYPFISFLWVNPFFYKELFWKAGDLMSWAFDRYEFTDESPEGVTHEIPYKEPLQKQGAIPERTERIKELKDLLNRLDEEDQDQQKVMLQKLNAHLLLGRENMKAFRWQEAEEYLLKAKDLADKILPNSNQQGEIFFYLGDLYRAVRKFNGALFYYEAALRICKKINENSVANIYHQIGRVYEEQGKWEEALTSNNQAIEWSEETGNEYVLGGSYHQIGMVYYKQHKWEEALASYNKAIDWNKKTGNKYNLGNTYHQIGMVLKEQRRWEEALSNYNKAIEWKVKTGNQYDLGGTYHEIGIVYEEQRLWKQALLNYNKAVEWNEKTGNEYELGGTYHQIGRVYEEQGLFQKAKEYFEMSVKEILKYNNPNLTIAEASVERIETKLAAEKKENL